MTEFGIKTGYFIYSYIYFILFLPKMYYIERWQLSLYSTKYLSAFIEIVARWQDTCIIQITDISKSNIASSLQILIQTKKETNKWIYSYTMMLGLTERRTTDNWPMQKV